MQKEELNSTQKPEKISWDYSRQTIVLTQFLARLQVTLLRICSTQPFRADTSSGSGEGSWPWRQEISWKSLGLSCLGLESWERGLTELSRSEDNNSNTLKNLGFPGLQTSESQRVAVSEDSGRWIERRKFSPRGLTGSRSDVRKGEECWFHPVVLKAVRLGAHPPRFAKAGQACRRTAPFCSLQVLATPSESAMGQVVVVGRVWIIANKYGLN